MTFESSPLATRGKVYQINSHWLIRQERVWSKGRQAWRWAIYKLRSGSKATLFGHYRTLKDARSTIYARLA